MLDQSQQKLKVMAFIMEGSKCENPLLQWEKKLGYKPMKEGKEKVAPQGRVMATALGSSPSATNGQSDRAQKRSLSRKVPARFIYYFTRRTLVSQVFGRMF